MLAAIVAEGRWNETLTLASGVATSLLRAAELVRDAGSDSTIETPGGTLDPGENESYDAGRVGTRLPFAVRSLEDAVPLYVDWLRSHPAAASRTAR